MHGYLALVLHAHLPYVRHPEHEDFLEENWLFEAITETYVPLFLVLDQLLEEGVDFRLTFSLSPTLSSMLLDPLLGSRYVKRLERTMELAEKEVSRTAALPDFQPVARLYRQRLQQVHEAYVHRYGRNLAGAFARLQATGKVEVMASAATHGFLPLLSANESAVRAQVRVGVEHYRRTFGRSPQGFWLPECGYYPGLDEVLREQGIRHTILETHGITRADQRPRYGVYAPVRCPSGVTAFGRDPESSRQVWSSATGYPGDYDYREFYRDIGYDLDFDYIAPYVHPDGIRIDTGIKYYRITGKGEHKEPYVPEWAEEKAARHAEHFLSERIRQVEALAGSMDRKPLVVSPYDAELFGHWWFEGPRWLDYLIRKIAFDQSAIRLVTLSEYLDEFPADQTATPSLSSWGHNGYSEVWLNGENDWIYRHLQDGAEVMGRLAVRQPRAARVELRALNLAARELLLAQASDWPFMIHSGTTGEYARRRVKMHLVRLHSLGRQIEAGAIDEAMLGEWERQDNIFDGLPTAAAFAGKAPTAVSEAVERHRPVALPEVLRIAMACPEMAPFAKTGGLADMVSALAAALGRMGHDVSVLLPGYRDAVQRGGSLLRDTGLRITVGLADRTEQACVLAASPATNVTVYLIRADRYFDRPFLYGASGTDYADNGERFIFFARAALELLRRVGPPHVLHAHDWQAAPAVTFLKAQPEIYPDLSAVRTVLTIHNLGYQGLFEESVWNLTGLDRGLFSPRHLEFYGRINFLKGGLAFADAITTVSPTYSREIQTPEYGFGLEGMLRARAGILHGIPNGADYETWSPEADRFLVKRYSAANPSGKRACKADLQKAFSLPNLPEIPVMAVISRLVSQKGFDLLENVMEEMVSRDLQLVLLGTGEAHYEDSFRTMAARFPAKVGVRIAFDEALAHRMEAGADLFLMPSRYEPCGLNQLYSLKYGTIPIVRSTGGLKDSVEEFDAKAGTGTGFLFDAYEEKALLAAVDRALAVFCRKDPWRRLMRNAMAADHSWNRSAGEYLRLYRNLFGSQSQLDN